jgi:hypothetical protein
MSGGCHSTYSCPRTAWRVNARKPVGAPSSAGLVGSCIARARRLPDPLRHDRGEVSGCRGPTRVLATMSGAGALAARPARSAKRPSLPGWGGEPYTLSGGKVYLTEGYEGAPFGLAIVTPVKAGPLDLEDAPENDPACDCLVVRAKVEVNPQTAQLTIATGVIPQIIDGIPLQIKDLNITIDRQGFIFNHFKATAPACTSRSQQMPPAPPPRPTLPRRPKRTSAP